MFIIEDTNHSEWQGEFVNFDQALAELVHRSCLPWDEPPNCAPCTSWKTCGRSYEIIEYDNSKTPWVELNRGFVLEISAKEVQWSDEFRGKIAKTFSNQS
jgi:hypothetical protein